MALNRLSLEKSPYLKQHQHNPVNWYAWGDEAFRTARAENKPIFLSIGYSTCYWCHVMEKDSFERKDVAELLNRYFVSIKVDREERPDVDRVYMDAVVALTGQGGWPMSVFLTPDLKPFWGGTFFYREQFKQILEALRQAWTAQNENVLKTAESITQALKQEGFESEAHIEVDAALERETYEQFRRAFDPALGGFGHAPKFPPAVQLSFLLRFYKRSGEKSALEMVTRTLEAMAYGGIYDHLAGGFHRYSTDAKWLVPHFEKMLYDNALLAVTYLEAYQVTKQEQFAKIGEAVLNYMLKEMCSPDGGFYSAQDAGEVGKEGEYYVWTEEELKETLSPEEFKIVSETYGVRPTGNFEGSNILHLVSGKEWRIKEEQNIKQATKKLLEKRAKRETPLRDEKILTSWNGFAISAMCKGFQILGAERFLVSAQKAAYFIKQNLFDAGKLKRRFAGGEAAIEAFCEDYAALIEGLINLYESDFDAEWLSWARALQQIQDEQFWDKESGAYWSSTASELVTKKKELLDNATPSANGIALLNLLKLEMFFGDSSLYEKSKKLLQVSAPLMKTYSTAMCKMLHAVDIISDKGFEVAVVEGSDTNAKDFVKWAYLEFLPNKVLALSRNGAGVPLLAGKTAIDGRTTFYLCRRHVCQEPTSDWRKLSEKMSF